jgi:hypothetical protein
VPDFSPSRDLPGSVSHPIGMLQAVFPVGRVLLKKDTIVKLRFQKGFCFLDICHAFFLLGMQGSVSNKF